MNEKRILIKEVIAHCNGCSGEGENVCDNCCDWDMWNSCFTREQAIEKMAKAIICRACEDYLHEDTDPLTSSASAVAYAEAALNALLEDKK